MAKIKGKVVVITGGSSGIGLATAMAFAKKGAKLVLAARGKKALADAARQCQAAGAEVLVVPTDIADSAQVHLLAVKTIKRYGHFDIWINDASVYLLGKFMDTPGDVYEQVLKINLFGYIYGMRESLQHFEKRKKGLLINIDSVFGEVAAPYASAYNASKFGLRAITESLQEEFNNTSIAICTVLPPTIDTPLFSQSANYSGRVIKPMKPVYPPEKVVEAIMQAVHNPRPRITVSTVGKLMILSYRLMPKIAERILGKLVANDHFMNKKAENNPGNVFQSFYTRAEVRGGWIK